MATTRHPIHDHIDDGLHTTVFAFWLSQRGERDMPRMDEVDFGTITGLVPDLGIVHVVPGTRTFLQGLCPTSCAPYYADRFLSDSAAPQLRQLCSVCEESCRAHAPVYSETVLWLERSGHVWAMRLVLPLAGPGGTVESLLYSLRLVPRLYGGRWSAERNGPVREAIEVKRVVYERFEVNWTSREFTFRCLQPVEDDGWTAYGEREMEELLNGGRTPLPGRRRAAKRPRRTTAGLPVRLPRWVRRS